MMSWNVSLDLIKQSAPSRRMTFFACSGEEKKNRHFGGLADLLPKLDVDTNPKSRPSTGSFPSNFVNSDPPTIARVP